MLVPRPRRTAPGVGAFEITPSTRIAADPASESVRLYLQQSLRGSTGLPVRDALDDTAPGAGTIALRVADDPSLPAGPTTPEGDRAESFRLTVTPDGIDVVGGSPAGVFYGVQALLQLLPPDVYRSGRVATGSVVRPRRDRRGRPRLRLARRDARRGPPLPPKHEVMRVVDLLAAHRINSLHFHLTEDQGWRIEIRKYPRLTEVGSWRRESQVGAHVAGPDGTLVSPGSTAARTAGTTRRTTSARSSPTRPSGTSPSSPRSRCPATSGPRSRPTRSSACTRRAGRGLDASGASPTTSSTPRSHDRLLQGRPRRGHRRSSPPGTSASAATSARRCSGRPTRAPRSASASSGCRTRNSCRPGSSGSSPHTSTVARPPRVRVGRDPRGRHARALGDRASPGAG